jgi:hypothetical protein
MGLIGIPRSLRDDIDFLKANMPLIVLRQVVDAGWSVLKMIDGIADEFTDATGIGSLGGALHDYSGKYLHNPGSATVGIGIGTPIGNMTQGGGLTAAFNGIASQAMNAGAYTNGSQTPSERRYGYIGKDWGAGVSKTITGFTITGSSDHGFKENSNPTVICTLMGSNTNDPLTATVIGGADGVTDSAGLVISKLSGLPSTPSYRYHWVRIDTAADGGENVNCAELTFEETTGSIDITVVSAAFIAEVQPSEARLVVRHQAVDAMTVNTDFLADVSRDGGVTWSTAALALDGPADVSSNVYSGVVSLSGQPAGVSMKYRLRTANAKSQRMHGVWLQWRG